MKIHKMILSDEHMQPIAVQIPYKEWLEIESQISDNKAKKSSISHFSGSIHLSEDPVKYQKRIRDEWQ